ncbi:MAG: PAAR domain-containing protein [Ginsengibacter sp.]
MPSAARITDMHTCPAIGAGGVPHIGGVITGPGVATVLIGNMPAAVVGDGLVCIGPPDTIVTGSSTVLIAGKPAARQGDTTAHGGIITSGLASVQVGG